MFIQYCLKAVLDPTCFSFELRRCRLSTYGHSAITQLTPMLAGCLHSLFIYAKPIDVPVTRCFTFSLGRSRTEWQPREDDHFVVRSCGQVLIDLLRRKRSDPAYTQGQVDD
jgi:hypothetical protein